jgi:hypothetical protein
MPNASNIASVFSLAAADSLVNKSSALLLSDTRVGIEVEAESLRRNRDYYQHTPSPISAYWNVVRDGSLRGSSSAEFVFKQPLFGEDVVNALTTLHEEIGDLRPSVRTSVHVHLDVRDMTYQQLLNLVIVYLLAEPIMFSQVAKERVHNPYCAPLRSCSTYLSNIRRCLTSDDRDGYYSFLGNSAGNKYTALNLLPMATQGSIEFRHKEGTSDVNAIIDWLNIIYCIKNYAMSCDDISSIVDVNGIMDDYQGFILEVFEQANIPALPVLASQAERDAGICVKTMLYDVREDLVVMGRSFDKDSPFWELCQDVYEEHSDYILQMDTTASATRRRGTPSATSRRGSRLSGTHSWITTGPSRTSTDGLDVLLGDQDIQRTVAEFRSTFTSTD